MSPHVHKSSLIFVYVSVRPFFCLSVYLFVCDKAVMSSATSTTILPCGKQWKQLSVNGHTEYSMSILSNTNGECLIMVNRLRRGGSSLRNLLGVFVSCIYNYGSAII